MSFCEHMIDVRDSAQSHKAPKDKLNIQNELIWGLTYRNYKENEKNRPIRPIHSPIDIPFAICRAKLSMGKQKPNKPDQHGEGAEDKGPSTKPKKRKMRISKEKPSLLDRSVWSQSKYMDYLSIPNPKFEEPRKKKYKKRCELEPCPPRFIQLSVPNKRKVFANWTEYAQLLPTEMLMRFEEILHTDQNLEPRDARYYYKKLDRQRRKERRKRKRLAEKQKQEKEKDSNWQKAQIDLLATTIVDYIKDEPLFTLNYKQMLLSDGILERLEATGIIKKPSRKTKNYRKKTIIEVADKFAIWIDTLTRFVDVQAVESDDDIPPLSIPSLSGEDEGEDSSDYDSSDDDELRDDQLFSKENAMWGEEGGGEGHMGLNAEILINELFKGDEGEEEFNAMLNELDEDLLSRLIAILSNCSDDFLSSEVDDEKMPGVRYMDILERLKAMKKALTDADEKPFLEKILIDWAIRNDPDRVDDAVLNKIREVAALLGDWLTSGKPDQSDMGPQEGGEDGFDDQANDQGTEDEMGEETSMGMDMAELTDAGEGTEVGEGEEMGANTDAGEATEAGEGIDIEGGTDVGEGTEAGEQVDAAEGTEAAEGADVGVEVSEVGMIEELGDFSAATFDFPTTDEAEGVMTAGTSEFFEEGEEGLTRDKDERRSGELTRPGDLARSGIMLKSGDLARSGMMLRSGDVTMLLDETLVEGEEGVDVLYDSKKPPDGGEGPGESRDDRIIKGHTPSKIIEHSPDTVCCLSLKTWAVWLLEITHNAHNWTQWMSCVIQRVREYAAIVRGDVKESTGETKVLRKAEWRDFIKETEENVIAWRQYSSHVKELSQSIVENFHGKEVNCCPKCLQDHLIKNVVVAHETLQALTEAISCAAYWQRSLDTLVERACGLTQKNTDTDTEPEDSSEESDGEVDLEEIKEEEESGESVYEIEGIEANERSDKK